MSRFSLGAVALALAAVASVLATGCAPVGRQTPAPTTTARMPARAAAHLPRCDEAAGEATMSSPAAARYFARVNLEQNLGASRGFLASQGAHQVRVAGRDMRCEPYPLGGGLTRCVAVARLCGR